jgi:hypothetical protein
MTLGNPFDKPEGEPTYSGYEEKTVVTLLESDTDAREAKRDAPSFDREKALIEVRNYIDDFEVFCSKILMKRRLFVTRWRFAFWLFRRSHPGASLVTISGTVIVSWTRTPADGRPSKWAS